MTAAVPAQIRGEVLSIRRAGAYHHLRLRAPGIDPNTRAGHDLGGLVELASAVARAGADGVTLVHALHATAIDPGSLRPVLAGGGGLSGPALHPVAVRAVFEVHAAVPDLPIIGTGGVRSGWDALELLLAGASAVGVGSVLLQDPAAVPRITAELSEALAVRGLASPGAAVGLAHVSDPTLAARPGARLDPRAVPRPDVRLDAGVVPRSDVRPDPTPDSPFDESELAR